MNIRQKLKTTLIACAVGAMSLSTAGLALAQGRGNNGNDQQRQDQREHGNKQDRRDDHRNEHRNDARGHDRGDDRQARHEGPTRWDNRDGRDYWNGRYANRGRGAGPSHSYYVGNRLPPVYHQPRYVINDWRSHQLRQPPRGYHWVQSGGDYLLVAITTGVILQLLLSN